MKIISFFVLFFITIKIGAMHPHPNQKYSCVKVFKDHFVSSNYTHNRIVIPKGSRIQIIILHADNSPRYIGIEIEITKKNEQTQEVQGYKIRKKISEQEAQQLYNELIKQAS